MVICACNDDHTIVKLLEPPSNANIGDRVIFPGYEGGEPATSSVVAKKKILEKISPDVSLYIYVYECICIYIMI
jgi:hypothetical protein